MSTITIHTDNEKKINLLKALLDELNIDFEVTVKGELTDWQKKKIDLGIEDIKNGHFVPSEAVRKRARLCLK